MVLKLVFLMKKAASCCHPVGSIQWHLTAAATCELLGLTDTATERLLCYIQMQSTISHIHVHIPLPHYYSVKWQYFLNSDGTTLLLTASGCGVLQSLENYLSKLQWWIVPLCHGSNSCIAVERCGNWGINMHVLCKKVKL